jgi:hypothetical protein
MFNLLKIYLYIYIYIYTFNPYLRKKIILRFGSLPLKCLAPSLFVRTMIRGGRGINNSIRLFCLKGKFRNFKFEDMGIFGSLCPKMLHAYNT